MCLYLCALGVQSYRMFVFIYFGNKINSMNRFLLSKFPSTTFSLCSLNLFKRFSNFFGVTTVGEHKYEHDRTAGNDFNQLVVRNKILI